MTIYESKGYTNILHEYNKKSDWQYIKDSLNVPTIVPKGANIDEFKRFDAPYFITGTVRPTENGTYKRNNESLIKRSLILIDYDDLDCTVEKWHETITKALNGYAYLYYPTIKHTEERPRYRLVIKPQRELDQTEYKTIIKEITDRIGLKYDSSSATWSQLQGLPVYHEGKESQSFLNDGIDYPIKGSVKINNSFNSGHMIEPTNKSITMKIIEILLNGYGNEGERNTTLTRFCGYLFNRYVNADLVTAYELIQIANSVTPRPLEEKELDKTFKSVARTEYRKRGYNYRY